MAIRGLMSEARVDADLRRDTRVATGRFWEVDALRGVAIGMMILYHFIYDLDRFGDYAVEANEGFWARFADLTAFAFIFLAGTALVISSGRSTARLEQGQSLFPKYLWRGLRILGYGMLLSAVTWVVDHDSFIKFGILHLIGVAIILGYPFTRSRHPLLRSAGANALLGLTIIMLGVVLLSDRTSFGAPWLYPFGLRPEGMPAFDYRPLFPWFGAFLLGIALGKALYPAGQRRLAVPDLSGLAPIRSLAFAGRWSLLIYLAHQPVLIALLAGSGIIDIAELM